MAIPANNEQGNLTAVGSPIVLQRRGSVYGANVPMITGTPYLLFYMNITRKECESIFVDLPIFTSLGSYVKIFERRIVEKKNNATDSKTQAVWKQIIQCSEIDS